MSIDEVMASILVYGIEQRRATINDSRSFRTSIKAAIEQHVAEAVAMEREECALICDAEGREWDSDAVVTLKNYAKHCAAAIRARADNEPNRLPSRRCSSLCSPDETFCAITKDGKCDAMDRSCDAASRAEPKP